MDFMDKIGKTATNTCKITVNKTNKIAKRTKLKMHINNCKDQIEDLYNKIGKKVYEKHVREEDIDIETELKGECEHIDRLSKEIEKSIENILILKDMRKCPECFSEIRIYYNYCPNCGKKQNDTKPREDKIVENDIEPVDLDNPISDATNEKEAKTVTDEQEE